MLNLNKSREFFDPEMLNTKNERCHIIGCGAIGSTVVENLVRLGITKITIWDFDKVCAHNITNQMFYDDQIGKFKVDAVAENLERINPSIDLVVKNMAYTGQNIAGHIFLCVDNIEVRKEIVKVNWDNPNIISMFDFRMRLLDAQHYGARWKDHKEKQALLDSMDFTHAEAKEQTPVSACGTELSVVPTVRLIAALGVVNFMNFIKNNEMKKVILNDAFDYNILAL